MVLRNSVAGTLILLLAIFHCRPVVGQHVSSMPDTLQILRYLEEPVGLIQPVRNDVVLLPNGLPLDSLINYSRSYIGTPYRYGGRTTNGFDCSGFVKHVYGKFGLELPPSSRTQATVGEAVPLESVRKGDLIFFKGRNSRSKYIGHVGIVVDVEPESNDILFIHSSTHGGLRLDWLNKEDYYRKRFVTTRRLVAEALNP
ncbi:MAG TPA: C40 family peptidase [Bacteroidales bacterium]|nr:C40 family peptidase [Bacteroidales bacterium]